MLIVVLEARGTNRPKIFLWMHMKEKKRCLDSQDKCIDKHLPWVDRHVSEIGHKKNNFRTKISTTGGQFLFFSASSNAQTGHEISTL